MIEVRTESFADMENQHDLTHWHGNVEVIRVVSDKMYCAINGEEHELQTDDICIINRRQIHRIYRRGEDQCTFQRLMIDPAMFAADRETYHTYIVPLVTDEAFIHVHTKKGQPFTDLLLHLFDGITELQKAAPVAYELKIIALLFVLVQHLYQYYLSLKNREDFLVNPDILLYRKITAFIYQNYAEKLTLEDIAAAGNVSKSKCCKLFREYASHTPIEFLNLYRLKISCERLQNTNDSIAAIAAACGFGQQSYYNRLFLREYGVTPKQYRESFRT